MGDNKLTAAALHERFNMQREKLRRILRSDDGREALSFLVSKFGGDVVTTDPYRTHVRIGEKRVVEYLQMLREDDNA